MSATDDAIAQECPTCHAEPGSLCRSDATPNSPEISWVHGVRIPASTIAAIARGEYSDEDATVRIRGVEPHPAKLYVLLVDADGTMHSVPDEPDKVFATREMADAYVEEHKGPNGRIAYGHRVFEVEYVEAPKDVSPLTSLLFTLEELMLAGDAMDTACKAIEATSDREKLAAGFDLGQVRERWSKFNSLRTYFREAQYGAERSPGHA